MAAGLGRNDETGSVVLGPGQRIGPYRLIHPLGEGGMGVVHLGLDPTGRAVAIKVLREHIAYDLDARDRLRREVETLALVRDARVAEVLDADTEGPRPYIVTRYIPGPTLERVVSENGPVQGEALLRLGRGLWDALNAIHGAGVIHRDLKPANVILLDGDPVVIDFGIAHVADDIRLTMTGLVMGTPGYLSPEVVEGAPVTTATDWWGWAATLAFAASGAPPFGRGPMEVVLDRVAHGRADLSGLDHALVPLLKAALSPNPAERPRADEVVSALDRYAAGARATLAIPTMGTPLRRRPARSPADASDRALVAGQVRVRDTQPHPASPTGPPVARQDGPGRGGSPTSRPSRVGPMLALGVGVLGVATRWPPVAIGMVLLWSLLARFADRSITSVVIRRRDRGRRRSDIPVAILASPWHGLLAGLSMLLTLLIPAIVAVAATFSCALAAAGVSGGGPKPNGSVPLVAGGVAGLLTCWWGPGGATLQRGSRTLLRIVAPGTRLTRLAMAVLVLTGVGLGAWAWVRHGQPDWWPLSRGYLQPLSRSFW